MTLQELCLSPIPRLAKRLAFTLVASTFLTSAFASSALEHIIYAFNNGPPDGAEPAAGLIADSVGNLYGTTFTGGAFQCCGTVFKLSPPTTPGGAWTESVLYSFNTANGDVGYPQGTLILDQQGNLYGTTSNTNQLDLGSVFELSPPANPGDPWTETILYRFPSNGRFGAIPLGSLVMDGLGDLFGTTAGGGFDKDGVVFELRPPSITGSRWRLLVIHDFSTAGSQGKYPTNNLVMRQGALYGTTEEGGPFGKGVAYELKKVSGVWEQTVLHSFSGDLDGTLPASGLTFDPAGNLYGTTYSGGSGKHCGEIPGCGTVFELSPPLNAGDPWTEQTLYSFTNTGDGHSPVASLVMDKAGNLYGTASAGGLTNQNTSNNGTVFELSPPTVAGGAWTETTLHRFGGAAYNDGSDPAGELLFLNGKFYGTTERGSDVFSLVVTP